jgi:hypothetical protein
MQRRWYTQIAESSNRVVMVNRQTGNQSKSPRILALEKGVKEVNVQEFQTSSQAAIAAVIASDRD